jgi:hypothetical protein
VALRQEQGQVERERGVVVEATEEQVVVGILTAKKSMEQWKICIPFLGEAEKVVEEGRGELVCLLPNEETLQTALLVSLRCF